MVKVLESALPPSWRLQWHEALDPRGLDGTLALASAKGEGVAFDVEIRQRFEPRDVASLAERFERSGAQHPLLFASFVSGRSRELLRERGISSADTSGNIDISAECVLISRAGAEKDPSKSPHPRASLRGPITGRIVRFLCEHAAPLKVGTISRETCVPTGNVSRTLAFLEREHLVERGKRGVVEDIFWKQIIEEWSVALEAERILVGFIEPHGIDVTLRRIRDAAETYALTGQFASARLAPVAPSNSLDIYARDIYALAAKLGLRESEGAGNVRIIQAYDRVALEGTICYDGLTLAAPPQIAADLLTLPHRSRTEYETLLDWMEEHVDVWRR